MCFPAAGIERRHGGFVRMQAGLLVQSLAQTIDQRLQSHSDGT
jgi:hypothetical protein